MQPSNMQPPPQEPQTPPATKTPVLPIIGLVFAILLPFVGLIISIMAVVKSRQYSGNGKGLAIAGVVVSSVQLLIIAAAFLFLVFFLGGNPLEPNKAMKSSEPIQQSIVSLGATKLCDNGDKGMGIDNFTPWYQAYYKLPDSPDLDSEIISIIENNGYTKYTPSEDELLYEGYKYGEDIFADSESESGVRAYHNFESSNVSTLDLVISRQTSVPLYCGIEDYGKEESTGDDVILDLTVSHSPRN